MTEVQIFDEVDGYSDSTFGGEYTIDVYVTGVAKDSDEPGVQEVVVLAVEDNAYPLGKNVNVSEALVDTDGSETLYLVLEGLPAGYRPYTTPDPPGPSDPYCCGVERLPNGNFQIEEAFIADLKLPYVPHYAGEKPYPDLKLYAFTQEKDLDQSNNVLWPIKIDVLPIADGIGEYKTSTTVREGQNEVDNAKLSLAAIGDHSLIDSDGSETVLNYTIDFNSMIEDAQIMEQLRLEDPGATVIDAEYVIGKYLQGSYTRNGDGTVTVAKANIGSLWLYGLIFWDSNISFSLRVSAYIQDRVTANGSEQIVDITSDGEFRVNILGTADVPTVYADDASGPAGEPILLNIGGNSTDTDPELGRVQSEELYYLMALNDEAQLAAANMTGYAFVDAAGEIIGVDGGDGTWLFTYAEIQRQIFFRSSHYANGTVDFTFTSVAQEDGTRAFNSAPISIEVVDTGVGPGEFPPPCDPSLALGDVNGTEDIPLVLDWYDIVTENCEDGFDATDGISVVFHNFPKNFTISGSYYDFGAGEWINGEWVGTGEWISSQEGAFYNVNTDQWVVRMDDLRDGKVNIGAPEDFAGEWSFEGKTANMLCSSYVVCASDPISDHCDFILILS